MINLIYPRYERLKKIMTQEEVFNSILVSNPTDTISWEKELRPMLKLKEDQEELRCEEL